MIALGIETATDRVGVALGESGRGAVAEFSLAGGKRHVETLVPAIEFCCASAGLDISQVEVIVADVGPGLFAGLRVGVAAANALASALGVPAIGLSSLDVLVAGISSGYPSVMAVVDARRGEVFHASYRPSLLPGLPWEVSKYERTSEPRVCAPSELLEQLLDSGTEWLLVGDGALRYENQLAVDPEISVADRRLASPSPSVLVEMGLRSVGREAGVSPVAGPLRPIYLRPPDAKIDWKRHRAPGLALHSRLDTGVQAARIFEAAGNPSAKGLET
ncbi:MAG: tRNA (adenosine(37)-N6)-threonylcarbamoyltransferase complex dimerization subunit type 1 TsaB [Actinomycetota bacterium]|nr:tRNA (adenosine(37)-N6)-threonylcarbamoyltransferase complex dimerization subunit type 1 TsaB [Actinomycetota bacterium]